MNITNKKKNGPQAAAELRRRAEEIARGKAAPSPEYLNARSSEETRQALHELLVHQIELEIQNEELRRAQAELDAARARYFDLYDLAPVGYCTLSEQGLILETNLTAVTLLGVPRGALVKQPISRFILKEDQNVYYLLRKQLFETGEPQACELRMVKSDGAPFWARLEATAAQDAEGVPVGRIVMSDITERKLAQEALQESAKKSFAESEEKFRTIFENSSSAMAIIEKDTTISMVNREYCKMGLFEEKDVIGKSWTAQIPPGDLERLKEYNRQRLIDPKSAPDHYEFTFYRSDGEIRHSLMSVAIIPTSQKIVCSFADITDRKRAEEALRDSELFNRGLVENLPDYVIVYGTDGKILYVNPATEMALGYSAKEVVGTSVLSHIAEEHRDEVISRMRVRQEGRETPTYETDIVAKDGHRRPVIVKGTPIRYHDSPAFLILLVDITDRNQAEEEKRILEERLNRAEKMESLGTLAGGVAHDLNNVLGIVVGYSEMLLDGVDKSSPIRHGLENVMNGGLRAAAIVDDLLTLARRGVPGRSILNLNKIIADCKKSPEFESLSYQHPSVKIKADIDPDLLNISGSSVHLGKSLYNLISNASEAMARGGVVTIKTTNQYLDKPIQGYDKIREGDYVVLSVSDTGEGISADNLKRIFEPFYTKKVMGRSGTGLGLAVAWGTVKDHHGYINVESEEGKGSTFTLYFPVTREAITAEHIAIAISEYMGSGESILVVDDVKEQRDLASGMLRTLNYNVASVSSGEEAVVYMKEHAVDLILLDMIMDPGMDGLDTYRSVLDIHPKQKAIIVSGFSESGRVRAARDLGAGAYVRKPYIKEKLGLAVRKELDRSE
jgi:PAS domain S-box-containing protein